jgi:hypothetical protein
LPTFSLARGKVRRYQDFKQWAATPHTRCSSFVTKTHTILSSKDFRVLLAVLIVLGAIATLWTVWTLAGQSRRKRFWSVLVCQIPALALIYYAWFHADAIIGQRLLENAKRGFVDDLRQAERDIEQQEHWTCPLTNLNVATEAVKNSRRFLEESCVSFGDEIRRTEQACAGEAIETQAASLYALRKEVEESLVKPLRNPKRDGQSLCELRQSTLSGLNRIIRSRQ